MLPAHRRLTDADGFRDAVRRGRRASSSTLVTHVHSTASDVPARAGFVVSKAVGNSVVRHRVQRRLRHVMAPLLLEAAPGAVVVVRALPPARDASSARLVADLVRCLSTTGWLVPGAA